MAQAALRLIEGSSMDKTKALDAALSQIERAFGKIGKAITRYLPGRGRKKGVAA